MSDVIKDFGYIVISTSIRGVKGRGMELMAMSPAITRCCTNFFRIVVSNFSVTNQKNKCRASRKFFENLLFFPKSLLNITIPSLALNQNSQGAPAISSRDEDHHPFFSGAVVIQLAPERRIDGWIEEGRWGDSFFFWVLFTNLHGYLCYGSCWYPCVLWCNIASYLLCHRLTDRWVRRIRECNTSNLSGMIVI